MRPTQIDRNAASAGLTFKISASRTTPHSARPTGPVWLSPVRQPTTRLRGYLNNSVHGALCASGSAAGKRISSASICRAQASERRASSNRPLLNSQRGDSGTQSLITNAMSAGSRPIANRPRQPMTVPRKALNTAASVGPAGSRLVDSPLTQPRLEAGMNSWSSGKSTAIMPPTPNPTMNRMAAMYIQAPCGAKAIRPVAIENVTTVVMNILRRPILSPSQPKKIPPGIAEMPEANRIAPDCPKVRCQSRTKNAKTKLIRKKSKKSSIVENRQATKIFH